MTERREERLRWQAWQGFVALLRRRRLQADLAQCLAEKQQGATLRSVLADWRQTTAESRHVPGTIFAAAWHFDSLWKTREWALNFTELDQKYRTAGQNLCSNVLF